MGSFVGFYSHLSLPSGTVDASGTPQPERGVTGQTCQWYQWKGLLKTVPMTYDNIGFGQLGPDPSLEGRTSAQDLGGGPSLVGRAGTSCYASQ